MNKISIYVLLILIFLGLSMSFSPSKQGKRDITNRRVYSSLFPGAPITLILLDSFQTGFLIKTYFQKYRKIQGFNAPETIVVRTSREFWTKSLENTGMSLFRRKEANSKDGLNENIVESTVPMPPGTLYVGDLAYGGWHTHRSGQKTWKFHRVYQQFPKSFLWGDFVPSFDFYKKLNIHLSLEKPFYGLDNEFGINGSVTKAFVTGSEKEKVEEEFDYKAFFAKYIEFPKWKLSQKEPK
jgi:hypothetical protein